MSKIIYYDLETTGLDPKTNGIHQLSGMVVVNRETVHEFDFKFRPYGEVEPQALEVSGLTVEEVMSRELTHRDVFREFSAMLAENCNKYDKRDKYHLCGYNNRGFDDNFLRHFWEVNGDRYFGSWFWSDSLDVMVFASLLLARKRSRMENFKLMTVARELGLEVDDSQLHDGLYDVRLTKQVFEICMRSWCVQPQVPSIVKRFSEWATDRDDDYRMDEVHEFLAGEGRGNMFELLEWASKFLNK